MAVITPTQAAAFIPTLTLASSLGYLPNNLTLSRTFMREEELMGGSFDVGQTIQIPIRGALGAPQNIYANGSYTPTAPTATEVSLTLNKYWGYQINPDSLSQAFSNQDFSSGYVTDALQLLREQVDLDIAALITAGYESAAIAGVTIAGNITNAAILGGRTYLSEQKVWPSAKKYMVVPPDQAQVLLDPTQFSGSLVRYDALGVYNNISDAAIGDGLKNVTKMQGGLGKIYGFDTAESQIVGTNTNVSSGQSDVFMYADDAVVFASRPLPIPDPNEGAVGAVIRDDSTGIYFRLTKQWSSSNQSVVITVDCLYGVALLRPNHAYVVQTNI